MVYVDVFENRNSGILDSILYNDVPAASVGFYLSGIILGAVCMLILNAYY